jgi:hypothetical protein
MMVNWWQYLMDDDMFLQMCAAQRKQRKSRQIENIEKNTLQKQWYLLLERGYFIFLTLMLLQIK